MTAAKTSKRALSDILKEAIDSFEYEAEGLKLEIADSLIKKMQEKNVNRAELAAKIGVSSAYITKALRGYTNLSLETLAKFAFALGCRWKTVMMPLEAKADLWAILEYKETKHPIDIEDDSEYIDSRISIIPLEEELHVCSSPAR